VLIGISQFELFIAESASLKSKRFVLNSIKTKLKNRFNISVSEVGNTEKWQKATLGVCTVANEKRFIDETLTKVFNFIERDTRVQIINYSTEIL
jgi:uncharacterized protein YlxP (DUF503 family)